jgi:hypothetical protein
LLHFGSPFLSLNQAIEAGSAVDFSLLDPDDTRFWVSAYLLALADFRAFIFIFGQIYLGQTSSDGNQMAIGLVIWI